MTSAEELAVARALRLALGYGSREERIGQLKKSPYLDVQFIVGRLIGRGLLLDTTVKDVIGLPITQRTRPGDEV